MLEKQTKLDEETLETLMPEVFEQLLQVKEKLENHYRDVCDIEFTIEHGKLHVLSARRAKRSPLAHIRFLLQFFFEHKIELQELLSRLRVTDVENLLPPEITNKASLLPLGRALPGSPGAVTGKLIADSSTAIMVARQGHPVILVKNEVSPEDLEAIYISKGVLTTRGGIVLPQSEMDFQAA